MTRWWLLVGSPNNWETAFENGNLWGLKASQRDIWENFGKGDNVFLYASSPVRRVIGFGTVENKVIQRSPLWPQEIEKNEVLWPLRVEIDVQYCLPNETWKDSGITTEALMRRLKRRQTVQLLEEEFVTEILEKFPEGVRPVLRVVSAVPTIPTVSDTGEAGDSHTDTINRLLEIGRLQKFIAEKEFNMEGNRLDVVWRRVARSVPTYVFEVHVSGNIHSALAKLKHAYDIWNSNIFLVSTRDQKAVSDRLLSGMFHEIQGRVKFIEISQIKRLLESKKQYYDLEAELGIL